MNTEIDYSEIPQSAVHRSEEEWEPPVHKFFGKSLPNGKKEKEPVYSHQEYPRMVYAQENGKIKARIVNSDEEYAKLGDGWEKTPAVFGYIGAPSFAEHLAMKARVLSTEDESSVAGSIAVNEEAKRRGRPAKAA